MKQYYRCMVWFPLLWLSPLAFGQAVKIRVVNANNAHPIAKQNVSVALLDEQGATTPTNYDLKLETDGNGEAQFRLPEPAPVHLAVRIRLSSKHWHCKCVALVSSQVVIQQGIVQTPGPELPTSAMNAKAGPGVILFMARPFSFLERLNPFAKGRT